MSTIYRINIGIACLMFLLLTGCESFYSKPAPQTPQPIPVKHVHHVRHHSVKTSQDDTSDDANKSGISTDGIPVENLMQSS